MSQNLNGVSSTVSFLASSESCNLLHTTMMFLERKYALISILILLAAARPICNAQQSYSENVNSRIALVIGNSAYSSGALKNPVNDAILVSQTLDSLGFDVMLGTDLKTRSEMFELIKEFGQKRSEYDVAFVYYAGHGIQIGSENFLLPIAETFESEFDVEDKGINLQFILRYLRLINDKVNILVLDACRNNPFESLWNPMRSLSGGSGLAKIPTPTGSIVAYSTEPGQTAPDGNQGNSFYTESLCKNMLLEEISIDQVFRNVRAEVLKRTEGNQRPVESTQLTGKTFYLRPYSMTAERDEIMRLFDAIKYDEALNYMHSNFGTLIQDKELLKLKGRILSQTDASEAIGFWDSLQTLFPSDEQILTEYISCCLKADSVQQAEEALDKLSQTSQSSIHTPLFRVILSYKKSNGIQGKRFQKSAHQIKNPTWILKDKSPTRKYYSISVPSIILQMMRFLFESISRNISKAKRLNHTR